MNALVQHLRARRVIVCAGPGGVGKTTVAASLAIGGALLGKRTAVLTVDPARRLANALGIAELDNAERRVADAELDAEGLLPAGGGSRAPLFAMMLNMKRTWDELIERIAPEPQRIFDNKFYQYLSTALVGSHEYMASEKLYELHRERDYDLLVLDTPPTQNALEFLDAPTRVAEAMDSKTLGWLIKPSLAAGRMGFRLADVGAQQAVKLVGRFTGGELLRELAEFLVTLQGTYSGFHDRAVEVRGLLSSPQTAFVLVTSTDPMQTEEAIRFRRRIVEGGMNFAGFVVNRVEHDYVGRGHAMPGADAVKAAAAGLGGLSPDALARVAPRLTEVLAGMQALAERDRASIDRLHTAAGPALCATVPAFDDEIHTIRGLAHVVRALVPEAIARAPERTP